MATITPLVSGRAGDPHTAISLIELHSDQIEEVARFRPVVRDFRAPRMQLASGLNAVPLKDMRPGGVDLFA